MAHLSEPIKWRKKYNFQLNPKMNLKAINFNLLQFVLDKDWSGLQGLVSRDFFLSIFPREKKHLSPWLLYLNIFEYDFHFAEIFMLNIYFFYYSRVKHLAIENQLFFVFSSSIAMSTPHPIHFLVTDTAESVWFFYIKNGWDTLRNIFKNFNL